MSEESRPTSRWSSSLSRKIQAENSIYQTKPILISRRRFYQPIINNPPTFAQRMAKTRHNIEELFRLYYSNNIKFDTFQRQVVTGKRIPSAKTSITSEDTSPDPFDSKHCVSQEQIDVEPIPTPTKRTVQVRIDTKPTMMESTSQISPSSTSSVVRLTTVNDVQGNSPKTRLDEFNESSLVKSISTLKDHSIDSFERNHTNRIKSTTKQRPISSKSISTTLSNPPPSVFSSLNISRTSYPTNNSIQQKDETPIVTGKAVAVRQRTPTKAMYYRPRPKSHTATPNNLYLSQPNARTGQISVQAEMREFPVYIGTPRVVSIPSKCSRYVLVTFPDAPKRYNSPTYVERLLLPERFPTLFQNIVHNCEQNRNNK